MRATCSAIMVFTAAVTAAACASGGPRGGTSAMPDIDCSVEPMRPSSWGEEAQDAIARTLVIRGAAAVPYFQRALQAAEAGIAAQPENPWHHILAGQAAAGLGQLPAAHSHFQRAEALCPEAVAQEILPARQRAWQAAIDRGVAEFQADDVDAAIRTWEEASVIWEGAPNAHFNLAVAYAGRDRPDLAARHYLRALEIQDALPPAANPALATDRLETRAQILTGIIAAGAQHFQSGRFQDAADAFAQVTQIDPHNRDAWYNLALALYRLEEWEDLEWVARRVVDMDPLNYNARIILFNAYRGMATAAEPGSPGQTEARRQALATLEAAETLPVRIDGIALSGGVDTPVRIAGVASASPDAPPASPVTIEFAVYGASGELGTAATTIAPPRAGETVPFSVSIRTTEPVTGWRYRVR